MASYSRTSVRELSINDLNALISDLSREELEHMIVFLCGYSPEAVAAAFNSVERHRTVRAARIGKVQL